MCAVDDVEVVQHAARDQSPSADHTAKQINAEIAAAAAGVTGAERALAADALELQHTQTNLANAKKVDNADIRIATLALEGAKDGLAAAQAADQLLSGTIASAVASSCSTASTAAASGCRTLTSTRGFAHVEDQALTQQRVQGALDEARPRRAPHHLPDQEAVVQDG